MPLDAGTRLGAYEVVSPLGAGGMGEVYRARDTKIGRDVALKILPESFVHDPERVARFQREAQVLGALNHPHIAAIYGLEESGAQQFLVLELVDGETVDARLKPRASSDTAGTRGDGVLAARTVRGGVSFSRANLSTSVTPDGQRFLISTNPRTVTFSDTSSSPMAVVLNWASALKK